MKKNRIVLSIIALAIICSLCFLIELCWPKDYSYELIVSGYNCELVFGCTVEEFFDNGHKIFSEVGDLREKSFVAKDGSLVLRLTPKQAEALKTSEWLNDFSELEDVSPIELNDDMEITIKSSDYLPEEYQKVLDRLTFKISVKRYLEGTRKNDVWLTYVYEDPTTGYVIAIDTYNPFINEYVEIPSKHILSEDDCKRLFDSDVETLHKFFARHFSGTLSESKIIDGNLQLVVYYEQKDTISWVFYNDDPLLNEVIEISNDFRTITMCCFQYGDATYEKIFVNGSTVIESSWGATNSEIHRQVEMIAKRHLIIMQLLFGVDINDISVDIVIKNGYKGETIHTYSVLEEHFVPIRYNWNLLEKYTHRFG